MINLIEYKNHLGSKFGALSLVKLESIYLYIIEFLPFHTEFAKTLEEINFIYSTKSAQSQTRNDFSCFDKFYLVLVNKLWELRLESEYFTSSFCLKVFELKYYLELKHRDRIWFGRQEWSMTLCHGNIRNSSLLWHLLTPHTWANMNVHRLLHRIPSIWSQQCCLRNRSFVVASGASKGVFCKKIDQFSPKTYNYSHPHINTRLFSKSSWVLSEVCKQ